MLPIFCVIYRPDRETILEVQKDRPDTPHFATPRGTTARERDERNAYSMSSRTASRWVLGQTVALLLLALPPLLPEPCQERPTRWQSSPTASLTSPMVEPSHFSSRSPLFRDSCCPLAAALRGGRDNDSHDEASDKLSVEAPPASYFDLAEPSPPSAGDGVLGLGREGSISMLLSHLSPSINSRVGDVNARGELERDEKHAGEGDGCGMWARYSVYLLYWYKSTNTDEGVSKAAPVRRVAAGEQMESMT
jgi:hypothetical protein